MVYGFDLVCQYASKAITLEQYNLRAFIQSSQDGFGDDWEIEEFSGIGYGVTNNQLNAFINGVPSALGLHNHESIGNSQHNFTFNPPQPFADFWELPAELNQTNMMLLSTVFTRTTPTIAYPDLFSDAIVPRITSASSLDSSGLTSIDFCPRRKTFSWSIETFHECSPL